MSIEEKPGVVPDEAQQDGVADSSPAETVQTTEKPASDAANIAQKPAETEPWHKSDRFRKLSERTRMAEERAAQLESKYTQILEQMKLSQPQQQTSLSPDVIRDAEQLVDILLKVPGASEKLGISKSKLLESEIQRLQSERMSEAFQSEFDSSLESYSSKYGIDKGELEEEVAEFIRTSPYFDRPYQKGLVDTAFRHILFDRIGELTQRKTNLDAIKDKQDKKALGTEAPSKGLKSGAIKKEANMADFLDRRIKEEGGEISFD